MMDRVLLRVAAFGLLPMLSFVSHSQQKERNLSQQPAQNTAPSADDVKKRRMKAIRCSEV